MKTNPLIGKKVTAVYVAEDKLALRFDVEGAEPVVAEVDADCCSFTWIESVESPENAVGVVRLVEDVDVPDLGTPDDKDLVQYYGCKIHTEKGSCLIDYRNESNGYYGGNLTWPGERHYGGVYGQANTKMTWLKLA